MTAKLLRHFLSRTSTSLRKPTKLFSSDITVLGTEVGALCVGGEEFLEFFDAVRRKLD